MSYRAYLGDREVRCFRWPDCSVFGIPAVRGDGGYFCPNCAQQSQDPSVRQAHEKWCHWRASKPPKEFELIDPTELPQTQPTLALVPKADMTDETQVLDIETAITQILAVGIPQDIADRKRQELHEQIYALQEKVALIDKLCPPVGIPIQHRTILDLHTSGHSYSEISRKVDLSTSQIGRILQRYGKTA